MTGNPSWKRAAPKKNQVPSTESLVTTKLYPEFRKALIVKAKDWHRRAWMLLLHNESLASKHEDNNPKDVKQNKDEEKTAKGPDKSKKEK